MKISIVTTAFNAEKYIEETLESVLSQRGDFELEYIVIDAKSTDSTYEIVQKYKAKVDNGDFSGRNKGVSMQVLSESDNGMYDGISKGFKLVTGDVMAYINADDFYLPNAFSCVCEIFEKFPQISWVTGRANDYNSKGHSWQSILPAHYHREYILKGFYGSSLPVIQQESTFWRTSLLNDLDMEMFKSLKLAGDFYLWHSFAQNNELYIVNSNFGGFRFNEGQQSAALDKYSKEFTQIIEGYIPTFFEKIRMSSLKRTRRLSDKHKLKRNKNIVRFNFDSKSWELG